MPRRRRTHAAGVVYHVLNRSAKRAQLFANDRDYEAFERVLRMALERFAIALYAYCLMPNHWHFLLSPLVDGELSAFMHWLTTTHARRWQNCHGLEGHGAVYQGRFKAIPVSSDRHFIWVARYVERNPVRALIVERAEDWRWSSLSCRRTARDDAPALADWPVALPSDWISIVNMPQTQAELDAFRRCLRTGEPYGDEEWCKAFKAELRERVPRKRGRPYRQPQHCPLQMTPDPITHT